MSDWTFTRLATIFTVFSFMSIAVPKTPIGRRFVVRSIGTAFAMLFLLDGIGRTMRSAAPHSLLADRDLMDIVAWFAASLMMALMSWSLWRLRSMPEEQDQDKQ